MPRDATHTLHVEIVSAELAPDGGPEPDVRCTLVQRDVEGIPVSADVRSAACRRSWNPVWKETLTITLQRSDSTEVACTLWDESASGSEPACLGESAFQLSEFVFFGQGPAVVRGFALHQGQNEDRRVVGTIFLRIRNAGNPDSPPSMQRGLDHRSRQADTDQRNRRLEVPDSPRTTMDRQTLHASPYGQNHFYSTASDHMRPQSPKASQTFASPHPRAVDRNYQSESLNYSIDTGPSHGRPSEVGPRVSYSDETFEMQRVAQKREQAAADKLTTTVLLVRSPPLGYMSDMPGEHVGVGLGLQKGDDGHFFVSSVVPETPAAHAAGAGMLTIGDVVESIDGLEVRHRTIEDVIRAMKGPMNSHVTLEVRKQGSASAREWSNYAPAQDQTFYDVPTGSLQPADDPSAELAFPNASNPRISHSTPSYPWQRRETGVSRQGGVSAFSSLPPVPPAISTSHGFPSATPIEMHKGSALTPAHWIDQSADAFDRTGRVRTTYEPSVVDPSHRWPSVSPYTRQISTHTDLLDHHRAPLPVGRYGSVPLFSQHAESSDAAGLSMRSSAADEGVTVLVFTIDEDFSAAAVRQEDFWAVLCFDLATSVAASAKRFMPLGMQEGSIIAAVEVLPDPAGSDMRSSNALASSILTQGKNAASALRQTPSMQYCRAIHLLPHRPAWASAGTTPAGDWDTGPAQKTALQLAMHSHRMASRPSMERSPPGSSPTTPRPTGMQAPGDADFDRRGSAGPRDVEVAMHAGTSAAELRTKTMGRAAHAAGPPDDARDDEELSPIAEPVSADGHGHEDAEPSPDKPKPRNLKPAKAHAVGDKAEALDLRKMYFRLAALMVGTIAVGFILGSRQTAVPWHWLAWTSVIVLGVAPWSVNPLQFFSGSGASLTAWYHSVQSWRVPQWTSGFSVAWIAASTFLTAQEGSVAYRAAEYGYVYGSLGGFGLAMWFVGVAMVGALIFYMRTKHPHATGMIGLVNVCFGPGAAGAFGALVMYRLLGLVWVAASTAGRLFVVTDPETGLFAAGLLCGLGPVVYCVMGGLRAQVTTHPLLALATAIGLLIGIVSIPPKPCWICGNSSVWTINEGADLILVRLFHGVFALPWCTATLTDRMFLSDPRTSFIGFAIGLFCAWVYTFTASFLGIYSRFVGNPTASAADAYRALGDEYYHLLMVNTLTSAIGGIDACFVSASKLGGLELYGLLLHRTGAATAQPMRAMSSEVTKNNLLAGRISVLALGLVGLCALAREVSRPGSLEQASLTGTMVLGLFPPMLLIAAWNREWKRSPLAFLLPVLVSLIIGITQSGRTTCRTLLDGACVEWEHRFAAGWSMGSGPNALNLGLSVYTTLLCSLASIVGFAVDQQFRLPDEADGEVNLVLKDAEHAMEGDSFFAGGFGIRPVAAAAQSAPSERVSSVPKMVVSAEA